MVKKEIYTILHPKAVMLSANGRLPITINVMVLFLSEKDFRNQSVEKVDYK